MTISNQTNRTSATGTNTPGQAISYSFPANLSSDLVVKTRITTTGAEATLTLTTDYTATVSDTGGTVTMVSAIPVTKEIHIIRKTPGTQSLDLVAGGSFDPESIEDSLDKVTKLSIENKDALTRTLRFPATDPATAIVPMSNSIDRKGKYHFYDATTGAPTVASAVDLSAITVSAFAETYLDDATAIKTMATLQGISVFNVKSPVYGAVGDGVTDDSAAISAAIADAPGGMVFIPEGSFKIESNVTIPDTVRIQLIGNFVIPSGVTLTIASPEHIVAGNRQQIFDVADDDTVAFATGGTIYPGWWGAKGDWEIAILSGPAFGSGTDDLVPIQRMFSLLETATKSDDNLNIKRNNNYRIVFPRGVYKISDTLNIGLTTERLYHLDLVMENATIFLVTTTPSKYAMEFVSMHDCIFTSLSVMSVGGSGVKFDTVFYSEFTDLAIGGNGDISLEFAGVIYGNTFTHTRINGPMGLNATTPTGIFYDGTVLTEDIFAAFTQNVFNGLFILGMDKAVDMKVVDNLNIINLNMEGFQSEPCFSIVGGDKVTLNGVYAESAPNPANMFYFEDIRQLTLNNIKQGSFFHFIALKDCQFVKLSNLLGGGPTKIFGACSDIIWDNCFFKTVASAKIFGGSNHETAYTSLKRIQLTNTEFQNTTNTDLKGRLDVRSRAYTGEGNLILNPKSLDSGGNVTTTRFTAIDSGSYNAISPLGFEETLITIDSDSGNPVMRLDLDTSLIVKDEQPYHLLIAWKPVAITGGTNITSSGANAPTALFRQNYSDVEVWRDADWTLYATQINLLAAATTVDIVWNFNNSFTIGDQWLFGGAVLVPGYTIKLP